MIIELKLEKSEIDVIVNHLAIGRYVDVANILNKIATQIKEQQPPTEDKKS